MEVLFDTPDKRQRNNHIRGAVPLESLVIHFSGWRDDGAGLLLMCHKRGFVALTPFVLVLK